MASKQIRNLLDELFDISDLVPDRRFTAWAKIVEHVNTTRSDGYAFEGAFIRIGTIEVETKPTLFLLMAEMGSVKHHHGHYQVVVMDADGKLSKTNIATDSRKAGWALRIRDEVAALLDSLNQSATPTPMFTIRVEHADEPEMNREEVVEGIPEWAQSYARLLENPEFQRMTFVIGTTRTTIIRMEDPQGEAAE